MRMERKKEEKSNLKERKCPKKIKYYAVIPLHLPFAPVLYTASFNMHADGVDTKRAYNFYVLAIFFFFLLYGYECESR